MPLVRGMWLSTRSLVSLCLNSRLVTAYELDLADDHLSAILHLSRKIMTAFPRPVAIAWLKDVTGVKLNGWLLLREFRTSHQVEA
ncbi:hypothetical protein ACH5RR_003353 [Cinchona calisaya]|uniref:Uncharacterized protein n=1 Tax=Cinchona calisaya TaxID=153742 RepID=A0ABD3AUI8_9GENT